MLFYELVMPPTMLDQMAVVQSDYAQLKDTISRLCPTCAYRRQALWHLEQSLMLALWSFRLQKEAS